MAILTRNIVTIVSLLVLSIAITISCSDPSGFVSPPPEPIEPTEPVLGANQIVFVSELENGNSEIFRVTLDSGFVNLTNHSARDGSPSLSPDRQWIVFSSLRTGNMDLFIMRVDGSDLRRLTSDPGLEYEPSWSPDGERVIFTALNDSQCYDPSVVEVESGVVTPLWADCDDPDRAQDTSPEFAPDGGRIYYTRTPLAVYTALADGSNRTLVRSQALGADPSPDGSLLLFSDLSSPTPFDLNLALMTPDGTLVKVLTNETSLESDGDWSSDGEWIAFRSDRTGDAELYIMRKDGSDVRQITNRPGWDGLPTW